MGIPNPESEIARKRQFRDGLYEEQIVVVNEFAMKASSKTKMDSKKKKKTKKRPQKCSHINRLNGHFLKSRHDAERLAKVGGQ